MECQQWMWMINIKSRILLTWYTFIVNWCDPWIHIPSDLLDSGGCSHSTPTHRGLGVQQGEFY